MLRLDYDRNDVALELTRLDQTDYEETCIDEIDPMLPDLYAFFKPIQDEDVYIKFRIGENCDVKVCCLSFHKARYQVNYEALPYRHCVWTDRS